MAQKAFRIAHHAPAAPSRTDTAVVVPFRQKLRSRHRHYLAQWLAASEKMGILDAVVEKTSHDSQINDEVVVVWVRENMDPAYLIKLNGTRWSLIDCLRDNELGSFKEFEDALHMIRPVLPLTDSASVSC